jgi:TIR domain/SIR2-like domain
MIEDPDSFWDELLAFVEAKSVIPIIGPELAIVEFEGRREPYQQLLARQLAQRLKLQNLSESPALLEVVGAYLSRPGAKRQGIYRELGDIASKLQVAIPEPFIQLANIRDLNLFTSFCTDNLLAQALNQVRFAGRSETHERAFTPNEASDLPSGERNAPLVYGLFGRMSVLPKYVVAEEDMIEWITALQIPEKRPEQLFDELGNNHLLFLGCNFPDWLTRFILRTAKNSKLSSERGFSEYLVDETAKPAAPLVTFLSSFSRETQVLAVDPVAFVAEFSRRWLERNGQHGNSRASAAPEPAKMADTMPPGSLFISYASEDRPAALRLATDLQAAGLPVWLDRQQLDWGSDYTARIRTAIDQCGLFLPVLSQAAEQRTGFYRKEWAWAAERNLEFTGSTVSFLFPLVIDDTAVFTSNEIPSAFKSRHIEKAPAGQLTTSQAASIVAAFNAMRARTGAMVGATAGVTA